MSHVICGTYIHKKVMYYLSEIQNLTGYLIFYQLNLATPLGRDKGRGGPEWYLLKKA